MPTGIVRFALGALACGAFFFTSGAAMAAPKISVPGCDRLQPWAATVVVADTYDVAPILKLPKALQDAAVVPVFGTPALTWDKGDIRAVSQALVKCSIEAKKRRDKPAMDAYAAANYAVAKLLAGTIAYLEKAKKDAATYKAAIDALPDSAELDRGLKVLLAADPAAPVATAYQGLPRPVIDPLWRLANTARTLAHVDREMLYADLAKRRETIQAGLGDETGKVIAAAPADADGVLALMQIRQDLGKMAETDARRGLEASIGARLQEVYTALRAVSPPAWIPPDCPDLYRWSGEPTAQTLVPVGQQRIYAAFLDDRTTPVYGLSVADWTDEDLGRFKALLTLCRSQWQSLPAANTVNRPSDDAPELLKLASKGRWIEGAESWVVNSRSALIAYRDARATVDANLERLAALPATKESLAEVNTMSTDPALNGVNPDERKAFQNAATAKAREIRIAALEEAAKSLKDVKVQKIEDLTTLTSAASRALSTLPDLETQNMFRNEFQGVLQAAAMQVLPEFQARLEKIPASRDGLMDSGSAISRLTGITGAEDLPPFAALRNAALARSRAIIDDMNRQNCAMLRKEIGMDDGDAEEPAWGAGKPSTLGEVVCGMAAGGVDVHNFDGPGMLSSTATIKLTLPMGGLQTVSLHKAEVAANQTAYVGYKMADANQQRDISVQDWEMLVGMSSGRQFATKQVCDPVMGVPEENLTASQRMLSVDCAVEILNGRLQ